MAARGGQARAEQQGGGQGAEARGEADQGAGRGRAGGGAQHPAVQRLQFFLSESRWDPERVNDRRLELLLADPATAPHDGGVLVTGDSGDRKDGTRTAHVGHQWLGRYGKTDNGVVTVTTVWADERLYYPVHAVPYTPARHFAKGRNDPAFRTKLQGGRR